MVKLVLAILLALPAAARAENAGRVLAVRGGSIKPTGASAFQALARGQDVAEGAVIKTDAGGAVRLLMTDRSILDLGPSSHVTVTRYQVDRAAKKRSVGVHVFVGKLWARVTAAFGKDTTYEVYTANAVAGVRGTELIVSVELNGRAEVICVNGSVEVSSRLGGEPQLLGAFDVSAVDNQGAMQQRKATPEEIQKHADSVRASGALDAGKAQERMEDAEKSTGRDAGGSGDAPEEEQAPDEEDSKLDDLDQDVAPPLDLEPGSGNSRVKGRVEVRDR